MPTARITRKTGNNVVKDEIITDDLNETLYMIARNYKAEEVLEIHITNGGLKCK